MKHDTLYELTLEFYTTFEILNDDTRHHQFSSLPSAIFSSSFSFLPVVVKEGRVPPSTPTTPDLAGGLFGFLSS